MKLIIYRILVVVLLVLATVLIAGTLYGIIRPPDSPPLFRIGRGGNEGPDSQNDQGLDADNIFSGIGRLRIPAAGPDGQRTAMIILSINFPYPAHDRPFTEELASRIGELRAIASGYFTSLSPEQLTPIDEEAAKAEILRQYNALLRLGKIETLYFGDLMILE